MSLCQRWCPAGVSPFVNGISQNTLIAILVLVFPLLGLAAECEPIPMDETHRSLWVQLCDGVQLESKTLQDVMEEVASIYASAGVNIRWKKSCSAPAIEARIPGAARVYLVARLPGSVRIRFSHQLNSTNLMAYTFTDPGGTPGAVIHVSIDSVEAHARRSETRLTPELLSRALGRVVAHELAHRFLQSRHTKSGLLKEVFDKHDLIDVGRLKPYFTAAQAKLLRAAAQQNGRKKEETADLGEGSKVGIAMPRHTRHEDRNKQ